MGEVLKKFGRYFLLEQIAQGGMAEIYLARLNSEDGAGRLLVIKRIQSGYGANSEFLQMFKSEIKVTMGFNHPNIVQLYDFGEEQKQPYIAMEYVDGKNLRQFITRSNELKQPFPTELAAYIIEQAAAGLHYAHSFKDKITGQHLNIIHRDISPQNILLSYDGGIKVIDFGIAKASTNNEATRAGVIKGKPSYLSPEQITGESLDARCDIFALGIVLWELLVGKKLFAGENDLAILKLIESCQTHVKPPSLVNPRVPKELDYIVLRALAKQREKRYQTAEEFQRALHKFLYSFMPEFNPTDLSYYAKELFKDEIVEERKRVQKLNEKVDQLLSYESEVVQLHDTIRSDEATAIVLKGAGATGSREIFDKTSLDSAPKIKVEYANPQESSFSQPITVDTGKRAQAPRPVPRQKIHAPKQKDFKLNRVFGTIAAAVLGIWIAPDLGFRIPVVTDLIEQVSGTDAANLVLEGDNKSVTVTVNNQAMAHALPASLKRLPAGKPLKIAVRGPAGNFEQELTLKKGESRVLNVSLNGATATVSTLTPAAERLPAGKGVMLHLNIAPGGGNPLISINGRALDPNNPVSQQPLDTALELVVERRNFKTLRREFVLESSQIGDQKDWLMDVQLEPTRYGMLSIHTTPPVVTAIISMDGKPWVLKTPIDNVKVPVDTYTIRLVHEVLGMEKSIVVNVEDQKVVERDVQLEVKN